MAKPVAAKGGNKAATREGIPTGAGLSVVCHANPNRHDDHQAHRGAERHSKLSREWLESMNDAEIATLVRRLYASVEDEPTSVKIILSLPAPARKSRAN